ncbi:DUF6879 family protein [Streptomyces scopuliridis]
MATAVREALAQAQRSAIHLEMRDSYMLDDPAFIRWQEGHRENPDDRASWWRPWLDVVTEATGRGVVMRRLRVVSEPLSDYLRYEYDGTFTNVAAGEIVRWLPRSRARDLLLPVLDGWVLDEQTLILHHFSGGGPWTGLVGLTAGVSLSRLGRSSRYVWVDPSMSRSACGPSTNRTARPGDRCHLPPRARDRVDGGGGPLGAFSGSPSCPGNRCRR